MKQLFFSFLFTVISCVSYAETNCDCPNFSKKIKKIQDAIDSRSYDSITEYINNLPVNNIICRQYALLCRLQLRIAKDELSSADSIIKAINLSFKSNSCKIPIALYKYHIGTLFIKKNMADSALSYLVKANDLARESSDSNLQARSLGRIAYLFEYLLDQPEKAIEYDRKAISLLRNSDDNILLLLLNGNRAAYFGRLYDLRGDKTLLDSVYSISQTTLKFAKKTGVSRSISNCFSMIAGVLIIKEKYQMALQYCDSGMKVLTPGKDIRYWRALYLKKADIYIELKDFNKAKENTDLMMKMAMMENDILAQVSALERMYEIEKEFGHFDKALYYFERVSRINDSIKSVEKAEITTELEQKYNKSENERRISELNQKNEVESLRVKILVVGVVAALLIIIVIIFFYRQSVLKSQFKALEVEQRLNRARMNPHFIFNALSSIQSLSLEPDNQTKISGYISRFSKIMRQSLESTYNDLVSIEEEISFLENYLNIQKMRFPSKFEYHIEIDEDLEIDDIKVPSMLLQPFIENSIEHGFKGIEYQGTILIKFSKEDSQLKITISDNGKGFGDNKFEKKYPSRAVQIITDRLAIINRNYKSTANFKILNTSQTGVIVEVSLPIIFNS